MKVYDHIRDKKEKREKIFALLIDPDRIPRNELAEFIPLAVESGTDIFLAGSSFLLSNDMDGYLAEIKKHTDLPVIIFPGNPSQVSGQADALLFLSVISGRNPEHLIGAHVQAAPLIYQLGIETIPTGYMLIESGKITAAQYMNHSFPIPRDKAGLAAIHALAGQYLGMRLIYLEAGSGALQTVPEAMITAVKKMIDIPLIVGGGIKEPEEAAAKAAAGADIIVVGNHFEDKDHEAQLRLFSQAIHQV